MKKTLLTITLIFIIIMCLLIGLLLNNRYRANEIRTANREYEQYLDKEIIGIELATIIDKTINYNQKNEIQKDEKGFYIDNGENSIKIDIKMITIDKTFAMESIYNRGMTDFVQNFNLIKFKCSNIEYHKQTGKVSKITFEQLEE